MCSSKNMLTKKGMINLTQVGQGRFAKETVSWFLKNEQGSPGKGGKCSLQNKQDVQDANVWKRTSLVV